MSGAISSHGGLTRRSFLKATGAVAGAAAVTGVATPTLQALAADYESGQKESEQERIFRGVCRPNCFAFCHLNVHVRDGKVVKTSRAPYNEKCYDRICQRGLSHVHRIYDPARLQYPMRRVEGTEASYGAFWGVHMGVNPAYAAPNGPSTGFAIPSVDLKNVVETGKFGGKPAQIKMLWMYSANPLNTHTDTHAWTDVIIPAMEYVVVADSAMTDSARYADMVLPIAQWFELEEVANAGQCSSLHYSEKAIDPLYESKPDPQIVTELAQKLGLGDYFKLDNGGILEEMYDTDMGKALGMDMGNLREKKQIRFIPGDAETDPHIAYADGKFGTASGRFEFYREMPMPRAATTKTPTPEEIDRERMARWFPPLEAWPENELYKKYPLVLMSERPRYRVHSQWFSTPLLRELDPEPYVKINPADAEARGISDGDYVECYNDRGFAVAKAVYSQAIRPGMLVYPKGWQLSQHKAGGWSELSSTEFDVFAVNNNFMDVLCEIRVWNEGGAR